MYDVDYTLELTSRTIFAWKRIPGVRECLYIFSSSLLRLVAKNEREEDAWKTSIHGRKDNGRGGENVRREEENYVFPALAI